MAGELSGAAQGAAIGTSIMPGWGTAIGAVAGAFMGGSSTTGQGAGGGAAANPQATQAAVFGSGLDGSGWQVNFGNNASQSLDNRQDKTIRSEGPIASANPAAGGARPATYSPYLDATADPLGMGSLGLGGVPPVLWLVLLGAVAWRMSKSKK